MKRRQVSQIEIVRNFIHFIWLRFVNRRRSNAMIHVRFEFGRKHAASMFWTINFEWTRTMPLTECCPFYWENRNLRFKFRKKCNFWYKIMRHNRLICGPFYSPDESSIRTIRFTSQFDTNIFASVAHAQNPMRTSSSSAITLIWNNYGKKWIKFFQANIKQISFTLLLSERP